MIIPSNMKGRGALMNTPNSYNAYGREDFWDGSYFDDEFFGNDNLTEYTEVHPKTLINKVTSPDVPTNWSMNPYQGCEHGCTYCYARVTHEYWGYSAGTDFEQKILVKKNAPYLLEKKLKSRTWNKEMIMLSDNTDCYQPAERRFEITRSLLEICLRYEQPVGIITKNALICRDIDILSRLAAKGLVHVYISVTTLDEDIRKTLEPRTSTSQQRINTIRKLSEAGIPTHVMMAPIIPGLTSDEIFNVCKAVSQAGAQTLSHTLIRLNGVVALLFEDWIKKTFPLKASRVMSLIAESQGGKLGNTKFKERMTGTGVFAESIHQQIRLAKKKYNLILKPKPVAAPMRCLSLSSQLHLF